MITIKNKEGIDPGNMRKIILDMYNQINQGLKIAGSFSVAETINKVYIVGMGGSAIAGEILKTYITNDQKQILLKGLEIIVVRDYIMPENADEHSLAIIISYSGNTEETISAYRDAIKKKCVCIAMTTGGKIEELFRKQNLPYLLMPKGFQPRASLVVQFFALLRVLENSRYIKKQDEAIHETLIAIKSTEKIEQTAQQLALSLNGKIPLLYASNRLYGLAYRWKCQINENAKLHAFVGLLSELNHNEIVGFTTKLAPFHIVFLTDEFDHQQIKKRITIMKDLVKGKNYSTTEIAIKGNTELSRLFSGILLGDLLSYYLAVNNNINPTPVDIIEELKKRLI
ncbi:bifunctional phosphoglucose/phosphomannose isomerase [Candidatus Woesearchaeota archaeon]|nr:bifunctional phosphoglucose/phosphomannose isomerase [Candidatus Woesearchaeota archaeon]